MRFIRFAQPDQADPQQHRFAPLLTLHGLLIGIIVAVALALTIGQVERFVEHTRTALAYRYPLDGQEGTLLYEARLLRAGGPLYQPLQPDRVVAAPYPPLHYVALATLERVTNPTGEFFAVTERPIFQPGRMLSLVSLLAVALLLGLAIRRCGAGLPAGLIAAGLWLAFPPVQLWATRIKPDPLALACTVLGLCLIVYYLTRQRQRTQFVYLILAAFVFALAFFTKQTAVAAPAATGLALLLITGRSANHTAQGVPSTWRRAFISRLAPLLTFTGTYVLLVASAWGTLDLVTRGQYTFHVWGLHPPEWWSYGRFRVYVDLLLPSWPLMLLSLGALAVALRNLRPSPSAHRRFAVATFCASYALLGTLTLVGAGTKGSHHNHLLEPQLALTLAGCSIAGMSISRLRVTFNAQRFAIGLLASGLLVTQLWILRDRPDWYGGEFDLSHTRSQRFVALIMSQRGEVLADDVGLLLAAGRPLRYDDPATMGPAVRSGLWDQRVLLDEIANQHFSLVLMPFDATRFDIDPSGRWTPEFVAALRTHYRILYRDTLFSYVPRQPDRAEQRLNPDSYFTSSTSIQQRPSSWRGGTNGGSAIR